MRIGRFLIYRSLKSVVNRSSDLIRTMSDEKVGQDACISATPKPFDYIDK